MAHETVANPKSTTLEDGRWVYRRGSTIGKNGHEGSPYDDMAAMIPQLNALSTVISDDEWKWNEEIRQQLMHLASRLADEIHERFEEDFALIANKQIA